MRGRFWIAAAALACAACSGDDAEKAGDDAEKAGDDAGPAAVDDAGSIAADDPCSIAALAGPSAERTFYVAIDEPGADDDACDGSAPRDEGGGRCPFKTLDSARVRALLDGTSSTRVEVRAGTYLIRGWEGLRVTGAGASEAERVVLSAFPGEQPVLDVPAPDGAGCTTDDAMTTPECVRQVLRISGTYTQVQGLTIRNGLGYHVEITGGAHHVFACNTLGETVAFAMRSDGLKLDGNASDIQIRHNDFSRFRSQAIDITGVSDVLVEDNDFHDPIDDDAGAVGVKFGSRAITIRGNRVHDFGADARMHAFSLGGTGSGHPDDREAYEVRVIGNRVWNIAGILAQVVSCQDCAVEDNTLWNAGAGVLLSASGTGGADCEASASGCGPSLGTSITGNRMRALRGDGDDAQANIFLVVEAGEETGLFAGDNVYCATAARFGWSGELLDHDGFVAASGTDDSSRVGDPEDEECASIGE